MKGRLWVLFFLILILAVGFYAYKNVSEEPTVQNEYSHYQTDEFRVMDIPLRQIDYSPVVSAILYSHLRDGSLPLTFTCTILTAEAVEDDLYCMLANNGVKVVCPLKLVTCQENGDRYFTETSFQYDLADMLKEGKSEDDVMAFLKGLQKDPKEYIRYVGKEKKEVGKYPI